jgi:NADH dehydrogenase FAD-containing subunit
MYINTMCKQHNSNIVVAGGGVIAVELAANLAEIVNESK